MRPGRSGGAAGRTGRPSPHRAPRGGERGAEPTTFDVPPRSCPEGRHLSRRTDPGLFPVGRGAMGTLLREHVWSASSLGAPDTWPTVLRSFVNLILQSRMPMFLAWGDDLAFIYNDAYLDILGAKHPGALGA